MNAIASNDGHGLPQREEAGVTRAPEADVVGGQRPAHDGRTTFDAERQKTVQHGIVDARGVIGDGQQRPGGSRLNLRWLEQRRGH